MVVDPMGSSHSLAFPAPPESLRGWNLKPSRFPVRVFVAGDPARAYGGEVLLRMREAGIEVLRLAVVPSEVAPELWCGLLRLGSDTAAGAILYRAVTSLREKKSAFELRDVRQAVFTDPLAVGEARMVVLSKLAAAEQWGVFSGPGPGGGQFESGKVNVVNLSIHEPGAGSLRELVVDVVVRRLFSVWAQKKRAWEFGLAQRVPRLWLVVDEAHQFVPGNADSLSREALVRWVKEGRQLNLGMVLVTQQPAAVSPEFLSQVDAVVAHRLTMRDDLEALEAISPVYLRERLDSTVVTLEKRGEAVVLDDEKEEARRVFVRPRRSGGVPTGRQEFRREGALTF
nr:zonular occludens toxin domain-containing protein [Ammonifex degensii]